MLDTHSLTLCYVCLLLTMPACSVHIHTLAVAVAQAKGLISVVFWPACLDPTVTQVFHHLLKFIAPFEKLFWVIVRYIASAKQHYTFWSILLYCIHVSFLYSDNFFNLAERGWVLCGMNWQLWIYWTAKTQSDWRCSRGQNSESHSQKSMPGNSRSIPSACSSTPIRWFWKTWTSCSIGRSCPLLPISAGQTASIPVCLSSSPPWRLTQIYWKWPDRRAVLMVCLL